MNRFILYAILLFLYLGLSKSFSPNEFGLRYVNSNQELAELIRGTPVSVILTDIHSTGFLIKTFYQKYKIIYGFQSYEELIIRTSSSFTKKNTPYLGMSVFRRYKKNNKEDFTPLPPGSIFIGNKNFGNWVSKNAHSKVWKFFRVYRQIPKYLGWMKFAPTLKTYNKIKLYQEQKKPFLGFNDEFGINGYITKAAFPKYFERQKPNEVNLKKILKSYMKENFIK